jgi:hypothetical protein
MKPIILLDIDGVLNPVTRAGGGGAGPELVLSAARIDLVRRLAACGRIAWVSTWPAEQTAGLEAQLQLDVEPLRVPLPGRALQESEAATPKLRPVSRWLERMVLAGDADWDSVVWIDDVLGADAFDWAHAHPAALLVKPAPSVGITPAHVIAVEVFVEQ